VGEQIAADSRGEAYYADIGAVPNVSNAKASACNTALGTQTLSLLGVPILDGSRAACEWDNDPDAAAPGIFGPSHLPSLFRDDYVTNSNDSYWLSNPAHPLEGFARIIGDERTARSLRTRLGLKMAAGRKFSLKALADTVFDDRQYGGELLAGELAAYCRANPTLNGSSGPVDVSAACPVLERWGRTDTLDDPGAVLFRRWATRALASVGGAVANPTVFRVPFDPADPVNTPRGLNTDKPQVGQAPGRRGEGAARRRHPARREAARLPVRAPRRREDPDPRWAGHARRLQCHRQQLERQGLPRRQPRVELRPGRPAHRRLPERPHDPHLLAVGQSASWPPRRWR
jgi:acyl-homoserine-lactone acylase